MKKTVAFSSPSMERMLPLEQESLELLQQAFLLQQDAGEFYPRMIEEEEMADRTQEAIESLQRTNGNLSKALRLTVAVTDELKGRSRDIRKQRKQPRLAAPANAVIDYREEKNDHFAKGLHPYKLLLVCFIGSFLGVVVELLWCLVTNGYLESRSGLVYGPFNLLYGVGAAVLTLGLYRFRNRTPYISFLGGMLVGSVVEYTFSWGQEMLFGSTSWDYSHLPFHLNGRICLMYSVFWGVLGVLWMKNLYPRMAKWILRLPQKGGKVLVWILTVFFAVNALISSLSVARWHQRTEGIPPQNAWEELLDQRFPDERMEQIFANMQFKDSKNTK